MRYFGFLVSFFILTLGASCSTPPQQQLQQETPRTQRAVDTVYVSRQIFEISSVTANADGLSVSVPAGPLQGLRKQVEVIADTELKFRAEGQIDLFSGPEVKNLKRVFKGLELAKFLREQNLQNVEIDMVCLAQVGSLYFVPINSTRLFEIRESVLTEFLTRGGPTDVFKEYHPYMVVGFTEQDLIEDTSVVKNRKTCIRKIASY